MAWLASKPPRTCLSPLLGVGIPSIGAPAQASVSGWEIFCLLRWALAGSVCPGAAIHLPHLTVERSSIHYNTWKQERGWLCSPEQQRETPVCQAPRGPFALRHLPGPFFFLSVLSLWPCSRLVLKQWNPPTEPNSFKRQNLSEEKNLHCFAKKFLKQPPIKSLTSLCAYFPKENEISFQNYLLYKRQWKFTDFCLFFTRRNFWQAEKRPVTFKDILIFH